MAILLIALLAAFLTLLIVAARQPREFRTSRSLAINAPPEKIFPEIDDLHRFNSWSPFAEMDPEARITYEGPASGVGAAMAWEGKKTGQGKMTITASRPNDAIECRLDFVKPMKATNLATFTLAPESGRTIVTWSMTGRNNFFARLMGIFMNCEKMVGTQFTKGLENLKALVEAK